MQIMQNHDINNIHSDIHNVTDVLPMVNILVRWFQINKDFFTGASNPAIRDLSWDQSIVVELVYSSHIWV